MNITVDKFVDEWYDHKLESVHGQTGIKEIVKAAINTYTMYPKDIAFNINDNVRVKLTPHGLSILKEKVDNLNKEHPYCHFNMPESDKEGYVTYQLWQLMQDFGDHVGMGFPLVFETEIIIPGVK